MRLLTFLISLLLFNSPAYSQDFLKLYKDFRLGKASAVPNKMTKKKIKAYINSHIIELDTVFHAYKTRTGFDFRNADTVFLVYYSPAESPFTSDIIIWSGKDTIAYQQGFEEIDHFKYKRTITYAPFIKRNGGYKETTERDSVLTLVARRDYSTIMHLGDGQSISDGSYVHIYVAFKERGHYKIESCSPPQFVIWTTYRKD